MLDRECQFELNRQFSLNPEVGNYWSEMCVPIALVLAIDEETVTYCGRKDVGPNHWTFAVDQPKTVTREEFRHYLSYKDCSGQWADVIPKIKDFDHFYQAYQTYQALQAQPTIEVKVKLVLRSLIDKIGHGDDPLAQEQLEIAVKEIVALFDNASPLKSD